MSKQTVYHCDLCGKQYSEGGTQQGFTLVKHGSERGEIRVWINTYTQGRAFRLYSGKTDRDLCPECLSAALSSVIRRPQ